MRLAIFCFTLFTLTFLAHLVWWRIRLPRKQLRALLALFLSALPAALIIGRIVPNLAQIMPSDALEWFHVAVLYIPVSLAYAATYSAVEEDSPSLRIVRYVADAGAAGRSLDDLSQILNDDVVLGSRFSALMRDGLVSECGGRYTLTNRGRTLARLFAFSYSSLGIRSAG